MKGKERKVEERKTEDRRGSTGKQRRLRARGEEMWDHCKEEG